MRIKLDENMPVRLAALLTDMGNDVETVYSQKLSGVTDDEIWSVAQEEKRLLVTQDLDFSDRRRFQPGSHSGIILIRLRSPGREALFRKVEEIFRAENTDDWVSCFVVVTDHKIRIHRSMH